MGHGELARDSAVSGRRGEVEAAILGRKGIGFTMALFPTRRLISRRRVFMIGLHKVGAGKHRHWLVDNWQAAPTTTGDLQVASGGGSERLAACSSQLTPRSATLPPPPRRRRARSWLLIPVGLLSAWPCIIPAGIAGANLRGGAHARSLASSRGGLGGMSLVAGVRVVRGKDAGSVREVGATDMPS